MSLRRSSARAAFTLLELLLVITLLGLISSIGLFQLHRQLDRIAARDAIRSAASTVAQARDQAIALHTPVSVRIDTLTATIELGARGARVALLPVGDTYGVTLSTSRDSIAFDVRGLGYGAANFTLVARRGIAADTLVVSRLGRVR